MTHHDHRHDDLDQRPNYTPSAGPGTGLADCARDAEDALRRLAHQCINRPSLTPAEVDTILGHLAETIATLPQIAAQLGDGLDRTRHTHLLAMDTMATTTDPDLAVDTARHHLDELRGPAVQTYRHLDAARNEAAHISATPLEDIEAPQPETRVPQRRHEDHRPPSTMRPTRRGPAR